ncbi:MAG: shikimate dehydrogenase family protein [Anaerolineae bacterium]
MTTRAGLLGWPVEHSISPVMHNAAFRALGLNWSYDLLPVEPSRLQAEIMTLLEDGYVGFNVTIPHKQQVLNLPGVEPEPAVQTLGAANTLVRQGDRLRAHNTDWTGFRDDLEAHDVHPAGWDCLVLGTGGSAAAVAYALRRMAAASVTFVSRSPEGRADTIGYADLDDHQAVRLVVNCTPLGMHPRVEGSLWPQKLPLPDCAVIYDLVYNPVRTQLVAQAEAAGLRALSGLGMLVRQGAAAFALWTGQQPPLPVMLNAAQTALGGS